MLSHRFLCLGFLSVCVGCSNRPDRVATPSVRPSSAGQMAIELYDKDGDGLLGREELKACPGILADLAAYDSDGNQFVTKEEISDRIEKVLEYRIGLSSIVAEVTLDGRPIGGVTVHLEPEPFWGDDLHPAIGITDHTGTAKPRIDPSNMPEHLKRFPMMVPGTYKIRVVDPKGRVPDHYDKNSPLGREIVSDTVPGRFAIALRSK